MIAPPRVANNSETEINKAFIEFSRLIDEADGVVRTDFTSRLVPIDSYIDILARSYKAGGTISYAGVADTHTIQPIVAGIWYQGTAPGAVMRRYLVAVPQTTVDNTWTNYPAIGARAYVTLDYLGALRLRPATGALTVRPTDSFYQRTGGGIGYNDISRFGYYFADGERIIGTVGKLSATSFIYNVNGEQRDEWGQWLPIVMGTNVVGAPTYGGTRVGIYARIDGAVSLSVDVEITNKGGMTGFIVIPVPFGAAGNCGGSSGYPAGAVPGAGMNIHAIVTGANIAHYYLNPATGIITQMTDVMYAATFRFIFGASYQVVL